MSLAENKKLPFYSFIPFLISISFASFLNQLARTIYPPLTPQICGDLNLCHTDTGNLFFILSLGFAITLFLSQFISTIITHRVTVLISIFSTGLALALNACVYSFVTFKVTIFFVGLCSGFFIPSAVAMIRDFVATEHMGKAFGVFATSQSFAFIFGPATIKYLNDVYTWKQILCGFGLTSSLIGVLLYTISKQGDFKGDVVDRRFISAVFSWPSFWILLVLLCVANGLNIGIYNMAPDYFQRHNLLSKQEVYNLVVAARAVSIFVAIAAGFIADKFGLKKSMAIAFTVCGAFTMLIGLINPYYSLIFFSLQTPVAVCIMPLIHYAISTIVPPERNASIVSIIAPFGFLMGAGVIPQLLGFFGDLNIYPLGFILFGLSSILSGLVLYVPTIYKHVEYSQLKSSSSI